MVSSAPVPCWIHRDCRVQLVGYPRCESAYEIRHSSGTYLGSAETLTAARELIDVHIVLIRQRLAATV
jgi:hypothetical protein